MYLRESRQKRADGSVLTHLQLAENVWDPDKQRAQVKIIYNCGRADDPASTERLRRLARSILRRCAPDEIVAGALAAPGVVVLEFDAAPQGASADNGPGCASVADHASASDWRRLMGDAEFTPATAAAETYDGAWTPIKRAETPSALADAAPSHAPALG